MTDDSVPPEVDELIEQVDDFARRTKRLNDLYRRILTVQNRLMPYGVTFAVHRINKGTTITGDPGVEVTIDYRTVTLEQMTEAFEALAEKLSSSEEA